MFTGLVQHIGRVVSVEPRPTGVRLVVDAAGWDHSPTLGDSIAVAGCCLTVAESPSAGRLCFDAVAETLAKTTLGGWKPGIRVNLEHAATATTLMGGHFVQGHVDGVTTVVSNGDGPGGWTLRLALNQSISEFMTPKGSCTIDGVSLTIATIDLPHRCIEIALIPTTLEKTTLGALRPHDRANIEADVIAKTVVHHLKHFTNRS